MKRARVVFAAAALALSTSGVASTAFANGQAPKPVPGTTTSPTLSNRSSVPVAAATDGLSAATSASIVASGELAGVQTSPDLTCYVQRAGYSTDEFYGPGACGTMVAVDGVLYGIVGTAWTPVSQQKSGSGTAADPWTIRTEVQAGDSGVSLIQTDTVVDGGSGYRTRLELHNVSGTSKQALVYRAGDCYVAGSDVGYGDLPGFGVACLNQGKDKAMTLTPESDGATVQEAHYGTVWDLARGLSPLSNTAVAESAIDNGMAIRWDRTVNAGATVALDSRLDLTLYDGGPRTDMDSDLDGLPDSWETSGAKDANGNVTYDLAAMGARKDRADVFIQVVAEKSAPLSAAARQVIIDAFAKAPVSNPDGTSGISVHFVDGPELTWNQADAMKTVFSTASNGETDWWGPWRHWLSWAPSGPTVFHYVASVNWAGTDLRGIATIGGQMVIINNCGQRSSSRTTCKADPTDQAANLMHELGHNLNLRHGGDDNINFKPNYFSIMNYYYSHTGVPGIGVDFSHWGTEAINVLDENSLAEQDGVMFAGAPAGLTVLRMCPGVKTNAKSSWKTSPINQPIDWNCQKKIQTGRIAANVNGLNVATAKEVLGQLLRPYNDWANILLTTNDSNIGFATPEYRVGETQF